MNAPRRRPGPSRFLALAVPAGVMGFLLVSVQLRSACVTKGYEVERLKRQRIERIDDTRMLRHKMDDLLAFRRVEGLATERLGLSTPPSRITREIEFPSDGVAARMVRRMRALRGAVAGWFPAWH